MVEKKVNVDKQLYDLFSFVFYQSLWEKAKTLAVPSSLKETSVHNTEVFPPTPLYCLPAPRWC